eukprot:CAMPEP_0203893390 /NCGR_PEP_ID=MMETSP0359-20131031/36465_1 /ASSEMBLY_ACC=CAM_ASM_000338 /TAXON_ID=268821 /ORGANISM="Scrippsiella Hangoei, Strain SHTV-5" /LENGTH=58 /DNA_ID=CAMNT_0050815529 /DNA_START=323 /DNA_END=499 /DNA_ORIENTATION=-
MSMLERTVCMSNIATNHEGKASTTAIQVCLDLDPPHVAEVLKVPQDIHLQHTRVCFLR